VSRTLTHNGNNVVFPVDARLVTTTCWCGIHLAIPENLWTYAQDSEPGSVSIHCPLGHSFVYNNNRLSKEREARENAERRLGWAREDAAHERQRHETTRRQLAAQKGATTKARKRHAAGLCPCCNRTFQQLARHMATKHPDYVPDAHV
jgi:hypothetical protein